ncbi:MAG: oxidoreductase [Ilumatobacteraceae bacterium]|nr:oxidoreductase [Ilumatobacteraceae bacterium]
MGYGEQTTTDEVLEGVRLDGVTAVVTGASTGLGLETSSALAAAGAHVVLAVRDTAKGETAVATIRERSPDASVEFGILDLASLASIREFAGATLVAHPRIGLLVNNAGVMFTPFGHTADGFELQFGTNHLGHFLLTALLAPALVAAAPSRVVNLSSGGHRASDIHWDDPNYQTRDYDKFESYGQSKTANILFTRELDRRFGPAGVHAFAVHPGMIVTELGRHMTRDDRKVLAEKFASSPTGTAPRYKEVAQGAATSVWAAVAPELEGHGGAYLADVERSDDDAPWTRDADAAARLWTLSEELVGQPFPAP